MVLLSAFKTYYGMRGMWTFFLCLFLLLVLPVRGQSASCVAVGEGTVTSAVFSLNDGASFLATNIPTAFSGEGVAVQDDAGLANPQWVAVGHSLPTPPDSNDANPMLFSSNDGISWVGPVSSIPLTGTLRNVWYSAVYRRFVVVGCCGPANPFRNGTFTLAHSLDGVLWTGIRAFDLFGLDVTYSAQRDLWVAIGGSLISNQFSVAYARGSPAQPQWTLAPDVPNLLARARGVAYSIVHDLWFVVGIQTAAVQASIIYSRDPLDFTQWKPVPGSGTSLFPEGFRVAAFNTTVIAAGGAFGTTPTTTAVFDTLGGSPLQTPVFKPSVEGTKFFNRTRGIYFSYRLQTWFSAGAGAASATILRNTDSHANPDVPSWVPVSTNPLNTLARSVACTTLPVTRDPPAGALPNSGVVLAASLFNVTSTSSLAGDLSVHGTMEVRSPLSVDSVLSVLGMLRSDHGVTSNMGGILVIGSNATLTVLIRSGLPLPSVITVTQYAAVVGQFASVNVESMDGCQYSLASSPTYGSTALTVAVTQSSCGTGLPRGALIGIAVGVSLVGVVAVGLLIAFMVRHRRLSTDRMKADLRAKAVADLRHDAKSPYVPLN